MKFRECDTINSKENIQAGYRNGSRIVNWWSFFSPYFHSKSSLHELELWLFHPLDKALSLPVFLVCELIRNCKRLRITVQLQPHQFNFPLKTRVAHYFLTQLHVYYPKWSPPVMSNCVPALKLNTRVCALHCHLPSSPGAHLWGIQVT